MIDISRDTFPLLVDYACSSEDVGSVIGSYSAARYDWYRCGDSDFDENDVKGKESRLHDVLSHCYNWSSIVVVVKFKRV